MITEYMGRAKTLSRSVISPRRDPGARLRDLRAQTAHASPAPRGVPPPGPEPSCVRCPRAGKAQFFATPDAKVPIAKC